MEKLKKRLDRSYESSIKEYVLDLIVETRLFGRDRKSVVENMTDECLNYNINFLRECGLNKRDYL